MTELISLFAASALALVLNGTVSAADESTPNPPKQPPTPTMQPTTDQPATPPELTQKDQEYLAALKQCEGMQDVAKQKCIDQAKQKYNRL